MRKPATSPQWGRQNTEGVLARAALLHLIAQGFGYPAPGGAAAMRQAFARLDPARQGGAFGASLNASIMRAKKAWLEVGDSGLEMEYMRLFHGSGPVSLRETAYGDGRRPAGRPVEIADVNGFYLAFGVEPSNANPDMPDHVSAEAEFLSLMLLKEAYAAARYRKREHRLTRMATRKFVEDHLGRWVPALRGRLQEENATPPYRALGALLAAAVAAECRRLGARPRPVQGLAPVDDMQADAFVCPLAGQGA
ncbi:MAG: TorD/DmsD family molecular chaperone [Rhodospirillales bacterium]